MMEVLGLAGLMKFVGALLFVLALMLGLSLIMRRVNAGNGLANGLGLAASRRRLKIIETLPLSARHRLVLIKRDDTEHLVILGPAGETVVEGGIVPPAPSINQTIEKSA